MLKKLKEDYKINKKSYILFLFGIINFLFLLFLVLNSKILALFINLYFNIFQYKFYNMSELLKTLEKIILNINFFIILINWLFLVFSYLFYKNKNTIKTILLYLLLTYSIFILSYTVFITHLVGNLE